MRKSISIIFVLAIVIILIGCMFVNKTYCTPVEDIVDEPVPLSNLIVETTNETVFSNYEEKIYQYPFVDSDVLIHLAPETYITRVAVLENGWSKVVFDGAEGYVLSTDLQVYNPAHLITTNDEMYITTNPATFHHIKAPHKAIGEIEYATKVTRVGIMSNQVWSVIKWNNENVYILTNNLVSEKPVIFTEVEESVFLTDDTVLYTDFKDIDAETVSVNWGNKVTRIAIGDNDWSKVIYHDSEYFIESKYLTLDLFPIVYQDDTCTLTIYKEWYKNAWVYAAHLEFSDYSRLSTDCANGKYNSGYETTSHAAERLDALFAVNGCYSAPYLGYTVVRGGKICNGAGRSMNLPAVYSANTGLFLNAWGESAGGTSGIVGYNVKTLVEAGKVTDTFCFGPPSLINGRLQGSNGGARAQRTLMGTNGNAGDIWIVVSDGRYNDGESAGLTFYEGAQYLKDKGCTFGIHLDGGGSSTMYFRGKVLNAVAGNERAVVDFVYFK